jgi:Ankyrin repeats (3 copies)/Ankyrin repeats (many copies)
MRSRPADVYRAAQTPVLSLLSSYESGFWVDQTSECIRDLLSKDLQHRPDATLTSKKLAAYHKVLEIPGIERLTNLPPYVRWTSLSVEFSVGQLFDIVKEFLPEGLAHVSIMIAQNLKRNRLPWADTDFQLEALANASSTNRPSARNASLLREVGEVLTANQDYEDAGLVFDWLLNNHLESVYNDLWEAAENGDYFSTMMLWRRGDAGDEITIYPAVMLEDVEVLGMLLKCGVDPNESWVGLTALNCAAMFGFDKITEMLLQHKANVEVKDDEGKTPLHYAAIEGHSHIVEILFQHKAIVDVQDSEGKTPLHYAAIEGHSHIVEILLQHKANVNVQDSEGQTPLHYAEMEKHREVVDILVRYSPDIYTRRMQLQSWTWLRP